MNRNNRFCRRLREILYHNICYKCEADFGKLNPDRIFYLIRSPKAELGFFGLFNYVVDELYLAEKWHAEPVIDWQFYPNDYLTDDDCVGKENAWEYFFEPSSGISLREVYRSKHVIMSGGEYAGTLSEVKDEKKLLQSKVLIDKYIQLNEKTRKAYQEEYKKLKMADCRVLGVKLRGTDFKETHPSGHVICPDVELTAKVIKECERKWGVYDKIFVVTEDEIMFQDMLQLFSDRIIYSESVRFETANGKWLNEMFNNSPQKEHYKYERMLEYLISVYLLAKCDALIAPVVGATLGAMRIKGKYENFQLIHIGNYD